MHLLRLRLHGHVNLCAQVRFRSLIRIVQILVQDRRIAQLPFRMCEQLAEDRIVRFVELGYALHPAEAFGLRYFLRAVARGFLRGAGAFFFPGRAWPEST